MNATERAALLDGLALHDELRATIDDKTLEIVDRRRRTSVVKGRGWLVRRMLLGADVLGLLVSMLLAEWLVSRHDRVGTLDARAEILAFVVSIPAWIVVAKLYGLYDHDEERTDHSTIDDVAGVFHMVTVCTFSFWALSYATKIAHPTPPKLLIFWAASVTIISIGRAGSRSLARRNVAYLQNTVIVGAGDVGQLIAKKLLNHPEYGINLVGFVDSRPKERREDLQHLALLGDPSRLPAVIRLFDVERVIVAFSSDSHDETLDLLRSLRGLDVQIDIVPRLFELVSPGVGVHTIEGLPLVGLPPLRLSRSSRLLKRSLDLLVTVPAIVLLLPVCAAIAAAIKLESTGPVFFRQVRMGAGERAFEMLKFRSMAADADARKPEVAHLNRHASNDQPADSRHPRIVRDLAPRAAPSAGWSRSPRRPPPARRSPRRRTCPRRTPRPHGRSRR